MGYFGITFEELVRLFSTYEDAIEVTVQPDEVQSKLDTEIPHSHVKTWVLYGYPQINTGQQRRVSSPIGGLNSFQYRAPIDRQIRAEVCFLKRCCPQRKPCPPNHYTSLQDGLPFTPALIADGKKEEHIIIVLGDKMK